MMSDIPFNKTKIIATVGPASSSKEMLRKLIEAGTDVFRLNFSHGSHEDHMKVIKYVRELNIELNVNICLLQDLQGPKIRLGEVEPGTIIKAGDEFVLTTEKMVGGPQKAYTSYSTIVNDVQAGNSILMDDGNLELKVKRVEGTEVITEVIHGGPLKSRKGINLPFSHVSIPSLTEKDREDLVFGLENDVEWVALSFVRNVSDIHELRSIIEKSGKDARIVAKIEKPEAVENIDGIIEASDAIMVARGDLGVEIMPEEVPMVQKQIVVKCKRAAKPVIIATQMMESMIENPRPTRAETNDVANAVLDGADTLMLSAETAAGAYPEAVVKTMVNTIFSVESKSDKIYFHHYSPEQDSPLFLNDTIMLNACQLAKASKSKAITGMTHRGYTAFKLASHRPRASIFIFSENRPFLRTMSLIWGVRGIYYDQGASTDETMADIERILKDQGYIETGDIFVTTASMPIQEKGRTNIVKVNEAK